MTITHITELTTDELADELNRRLAKSKAHKIIQTVADVFGVHPAQILAYDKQSAPSKARALAMALVSEEHTLAETARIFQRQNHTTVISAKKRADVLAREDEAFRTRVKMVIQRLKA